MMAMADQATLCCCSSSSQQLQLGANRRSLHGAWDRRCMSQLLHRSNVVSPHRQSQDVECCAVRPECRTNGGVQKVVAGAGLALLAASLSAGEAMAAEEVASGWDMDLVVAVACAVEAVALIGAAVGGTLARQRKVELERINAQLRQINLNLRRQARVESYAPGLKYAPVVATVGRAEYSRTTDPVKEELMQRLRAGKKWLREQKPEKAFLEFEQGLALARRLQDSVEEKKAARGLGASCQRQGKFADAIKYHSMVLSVSERTGEQSGDTEAYGAIADCYTELGDLETAAKFYDKYIERLEDN